eukprot:TRINITY_DN50_c0_g1_i1.p1 TRINITY_DN50_c0_g1~~TRINITY_DN50_c0_g1_i1.p1  ORF type:complete len:125 (-),score=53.80 TRINITY_DN50_c0_g1_i1:255-629(-)
MPRQFNVKKAVFTAEETAKWKEINAAIASKKNCDPKAAVKRIDTAILEAAKENVADDSIDDKDKDYVGIVLGGYASGEAMVGGNLDTSDDVYTEEPRVVAEDDEQDEDERSLWGDGDDDPADEA